MVEGGACAWGERRGSRGYWERENMVGDREDGERERDEDRGRGV